MGVGGGAGGAPTHSGNNVQLASPAGKPAKRVAPPAERLSLRRHLGPFPLPLHVACAAPAALRCEALLQQPLLLTLLSCIHLLLLLLLCTLGRQAGSPGRLAVRVAHDADAVGALRAVVLVAVPAPLCRGGGRPRGVA